MARYSFAVFPIAQGAARPCRACRSATSIGASSPNCWPSSELERPASVVRDDARVGIDRAHRGVPEPPQLEEPLLPPEDVSPPTRVLRIVSPRQIEPGCGLEICPAMLAVALAGSVPAVDEDSVDAIARHDLFVHFGHEFEVVRPQPAGHPHLGRCPVAARIALRVHGDPIRMRGLNVVVGRVRVGAHEHHHTKLAAAGDQIAKHVAVAEPLARMMERNLRRVVGHASAATQASRRGLGPPEIVQPKAKVKLAGVVLDQRELRPAHRFVDPRGSGSNRGRGRLVSSKQAGGELNERRGRTGDGGGLQEASASTRWCGHGRPDEAKAVKSLLAPQPSPATRSMVRGGVPRRTFRNRQNVSISPDGVVASDRQAEVDDRLAIQDAGQSRGGRCLASPGSENSFRYPLDIRLPFANNLAMAITRRQRQVYDFISEFVQKNGYSPSFDEIGQGMGLSSLATVHKHISNLEKKGLLTRDYNRSRSIDLLPPKGRLKQAMSVNTTMVLPLMGRIAAGQPIEAVQNQ